MRKPLPASLNPAADDPSWLPPVDVNDLAVRLEMDGVTDAVAVSDYGYSSAWDMAAAHLPKLRAKERPVRSEIAAPPAWSGYLRGISFAFPLLVCALAMAWLKFSLWGGDVNADLAAAVGLGTVLSFVATGGVVQMMANRSLFFSGVREFRMSERCAWIWIGRGIIGVGATSVLLLLASAYFQLLPHSLTYVAAGFHICLGLFWLSSSLLYTLDKTWEIVAAVLAGVAMVVGLHLFIGVSLTTAQMCGILLVSLLGFGAGMYHLRRRSASDPLEVRKQPLAFDLFLAWPYFIYGTLYYVFLFADRILAWTASTFGAPLSLQFRGSYETALDIALVAFVLQVGWVLPASSRFLRRIAEVQGGLGMNQTDELHRQMSHRYWRSLLDFTMLAAAATLVVYFAAGRMGLVDNQTVNRITMWALAGYPLLVVGLYNSSLLFRLDGASATLKPILTATAANLVAGYLLSRIISFEWAVAGFVAGGVILAVASTLAVRRRLSALDYHYFAAGA